MKKSTLLIIAGTATLAWAGEPEFKISTTATLKDGSVLKAEFMNDSVKGSTIFAQNLDLKPELIQNLTFKGTNGDARATLSNTDTFAITISDKAYSIKTALGDLDVPVCNLRALAFKKVSCSTGSADGLIFHCSFDDEGIVRTPNVGPSAVFCKPTLSNGKFNQALLAQRYRPQAAYDLPPYFFGKSGCIEFWAKILKESPAIGWGGDPRLFTIIDRESNRTFITLDIVSNNGAGNSGFYTHTPTGVIASILGMRSLSYDELFNGSNWREWHHFAIVWDANGIASLPNAEKRTAALLVDGKLTPSAKFDSRDGSYIERIISLPARLSFTNDPDQDHEHQTKSPFLIDEFKIWNYAKTEFELDD